MKVLLAGMGLATLIAYPIAFVKAWSFPISWHPPLFAVGVLLMFLGSVLRRYCWRTLGEYFTGDVSVKQDQPIISSGPYRLVRHPSYTAGMMMYIGIGLALGSWFSLALLTIATIATYSYRVLVEERVLLDALGEPYDAYLKGRKRFIPYIV
jgi:protein-S-isoprenylcysteine O-methyltransferase Ste14